MSAVASQEPDGVVESLRTYSPQAVRAAINAARDPEKAGELVRRLEALVAGYPETDFAAAGLCVALGEAKVAPAAPVLLRIVTGERELGALMDAAKYALMRMGEPAFEQAMRCIASAPGSSAGVTAYEVLCAAADADEPVRRRVADFCVEQAPLEMNRQTAVDEWHTGHAACEVLVWLRDPRALPLLEPAVERNPDDEFYEDLLGTLEYEVEPERIEPEWREDWVDRCDELADALELDRDESQDHDEEESSETKDNPYAALLDEFAVSDRSRNLPVEPRMAAGMMGQLIDLGVTYLDEDFSFENVDDVREVLLEVLPRKVIDEAAYFAEVPAAFEAFVHFLYERGAVKDPDRLLELAAEARTELPRRAADPANWGIAKRMFTHQGITGGLPPIRGFDLDSAVRRISKVLDVELDSELREQAPVDVEPVKPIRRESPKVGRNDPCPCGSGKKYKKCCGG